MNKSSTEWIAFVWPGAQIEEAQQPSTPREPAIAAQPRPADAEWDQERWDGLA